jgi:predicted small lipoprotein YifL
MTRTRLTLPVAIAISAFALTGCGRKEAPPADSVAAAPAPVTPAMVTTIETGKTLGADKRITDTTSTFAPNDTMFVSVVTSNASGSNQLKAVVTFQDGQVVDSSSQTIATPTMPGGSSVTEFHLAKPSGWPTGDYTVEVWLDGQSVGSRRLTVKR